MSNLIRCDRFGILYRPPTRPDPSARLERGKAHKRPCVVQPAQKGPTCMNYALKRVRIPIGKDAPGFERQREIEKQFSVYRRFNTAIGAIGKSVGETEEFYQTILAHPYMDVVMKEVQSNGEILREYGEWESFTCLEKWHVSRNVFNRIKLRDFQLTPSTWVPTAPASLLLKKLKARGPLYVHGDFGNTFYKDPPSLLERISAAQFPIYSWGRQENRKEGPGVHAVCVIGVDLLDKGRVYFVDPNDPTDPADIDSQKIYMMPYAIFQSKIRNSLMDTISEESLTTPLSKEFAFYYDGWMLPEERTYEPSTSIGKLTKSLCISPERRETWEALIGKLSEEDRSLILLTIGTMMGETALESGEECLHQCPHITKQAVRQMIVEKYERLSPVNKRLTLERCLELDPGAVADIENPLVLTQNLPRLADALENMG